MAGPPKRGARERALDGLKKRHEEERLALKKKQDEEEAQVLNRYSRTSSAYQNPSTLQNSLFDDQPGPATASQLPSPVIQKRTELTAKFTQAQDALMTTPEPSLSVRSQSYMQPVKVPSDIECIDLTGDDDAAQTTTPVNKPLSVEEFRAKIGDEFAYKLTPDGPIKREPDDGPIKREPSDSPLFVTPSGSPTKAAKPQSPGKKRAIQPDVDPEVSVSRFRQQLLDRGPIMKPPVSIPRDSNSLSALEMQKRDGHFVRHIGEHERTKTWSPKIKAPFYKPVDLNRLDVEEEAERMSLLSRFKSKRIHETDASNEDGAAADVQMKDSEKEPLVSSLRSEVATRHGQDLEPKSTLHDKQQDEAGTSPMALRFTTPLPKEVTSSGEPKTPQTPKNDEFKVPALRQTLSQETPTTIFNSPRPQLQRELSATSTIAPKLPISAVHKRKRTVDLSPESSPDPSADPKPAIPISTSARVAKRPKGKNGLRPSTPPPLLGNSKPSTPDAPKGIRHSNTCLASASPPVSPSVRAANMLEASSKNFAKRRASVAVRRSAPPAPNFRSSTAVLNRRLSQRAACTEADAKIKNLMQEETRLHKLKEHEHLAELGELLEISSDSDGGDVVDVHGRLSSMSLNPRGDSEKTFELWKNRRLAGDRHLAKSMSADHEMAKDG